MTDFAGHNELNYRSSGVDIDAGESVVASIRDVVAGTHGPEVLRGLGHFGGFYRLGPASEGTTLVASIDGVGTKLKVAVLAGKHHGVGIDIVHHCINDILACGARPLFFLDYFATGRLDPSVATEVVTGVADACSSLGVALLGGETAEMPDVYAGGDYDLAGVIVGIVDERAIVDGSQVRAGDVVVGLPSDGFHTNGYSLIRRALGLNGESKTARETLQASVPYDADLTVGDALLTPHRSYLAEVTPLLEKGLVRGMAHITGGGIAGNLGRVVPDGLVAEIDTKSWEIPPLFDYVAEAGRIPASECFRVFNMGVGFVVVGRQEDVDAILGRVEGSRVIGTVHAGDGPKRVELV